MVFTVNGRMYELDSEYINWELPLPTLFYDREKSEPIRFVEREVSYEGETISVIQLVGHIFHAHLHFHLLH